MELECGFALTDDQGDGGDVTPSGNLQQSGLNLNGEVK